MNDMNLQNNINDTMHNNTAIATVKIYGKKYCVDRIINALVQVPVDHAVASLQLMPGKYARALRKLIQSAAANARNKGIADKLIFSELSTGRATALRRIEWKGRGRTGAQNRAHCNIRVIVKGVKNG